MIRPQIWIGDALRALNVARDENERAQILTLLGFTRADALLAENDEEQLAVPVFEPNAPRWEPAKRQQEDGSLPRPVAAERNDASAVTANLPLLQPERTEASGAMRDPSTPLPRPTTGHSQRPHLPLLAPYSASAILRAALARHVKEGPIDMPALLDTVAHGRPVSHLPRLSVSTLRFGVQVLVDRSTGMQPFRRDQDQLVAQIRSVVGSGLVEVGYFSDLPQRGTGPGARWTRAAYEPPERGKRILLLSDLGLGGLPYDDRRGTRAEWEEFVGIISRAGCQAVAFSPYPPTRWPGWMTNLLPLVSWDRSTTASWVAARVS